MPDRLPARFFAWFANSCGRVILIERGQKTAPLQTVPAGVLRATTSRCRTYELKSRPAAQAALFLYSLKSLRFWA